MVEEPQQEEPNDGKVRRRAWRDSNPGWAPPPRLSPS